MSLTRYRVTIEEITITERTVLGWPTASIHSRTIVDVEAESKPTLRALAAVLEPEGS